MSLFIIGYLSTISSNHNKKTAKLSNASPSKMSLSLLRVSSSRTSWKRKRWPSSARADPDVGANGAGAGGDSVGGGAAASEWTATGATVEADTTGWNQRSTAAGVASPAEASGFFSGDAGDAAEGRGAGGEARTGARGGDLFDGGLRYSRWPVVAGVVSVGSIVIAVVAAAAAALHVVETVIG